MRNERHVGCQASLERLTVVVVIDVSSVDPIILAFIATLGTYALTGRGDAEGPRVAWQRSTLLMLAITLHNFPEALAVGVRFGGGDVGAATALAIEIGLQNVPGGLAIALPLRRGGMSAWRAFFWASCRPSSSRSLA